MKSVDERNMKGKELCRKMREEGEKKLRERERDQRGGGVLKRWGQKVGRLTFI